MKNKVYSFAKFYEPSKIHDAVRVLLSAGIAREHIRVLSPTKAAERNNINPPDIKRGIFKGGLIGALAGLFFGALIFVLPKFLFDYPYENELAIVGQTIFLGAGTAIGILQFLMLARRQSGDHVIGPDEHGVFVTVHDNAEEERLNRAKDEFNRLEFANA